MRRRNCRKRCQGKERQGREDRRKKRKRKKERKKERKKFLTNTYGFGANARLSYNCSIAESCFPG
jgi:hypothetical protein